MGSNAPLEIRPEVQRHHTDAGRHVPNIDVIELQKGAHDRPIKKGPRHPSSEPTELHYGSINDLLGTKVTDRDNKICKTNAKPGQVPILKDGVPSKGCEYTDATKNPLAASIYKQHKDQTVLLRVQGESGNRKGSGVMVDKDKDTCTILSDVHVTNGLKNDKTIYGISITTSSGETFPATFKKGDPTQDLSLVTMQTGKETDRVCKPVTVAKDQSSTTKGQHLVTLGYPEQSTSVYASPGVSNGNQQQLIYEFGNTTSMKDHPWVGQFSAVVKGEDTGRAVIEQSAQIYPGNSGGPTFNKAGELVGVANRTKGDTLSLTTPVTKATLEELKK